MIGLRTLLSKNCSTATVINTMMTDFTEMVNAIKMAGTAPIIGPKYGITFVAPISMPRTSGYGIWKSQSTMAAAPRLKNRQAAALEYNHQAIHPLL